MPSRCSSIPRGTTSAPESQPALSTLATWATWSSAIKEARSRAVNPWDTTYATAWPAEFLRFDQSRSSLQGFANARQVMPAVPQSMVLNNKLGRDRGTVAERETRGGIQLFIGKGTNRSRRLCAVLAQKLKRCGLGYCGLLASMFRVQLRNHLPGNLADGLSFGDGSSQLNLHRIHRSHMVNHDSDCAMVTRRHWGSPLLFRKLRRKCR